MKYSESEISKLFYQNLDDSKEKLLRMFKDSENKPPISGWVFEQIIYQCIQDELGDNAEIKSQVKLKKRVKVDLKVGNVFIELKTNGIYSHFEPYREYKNEAKSQDCEYVILVLKEQDGWKKKTLKLLSDVDVFFLDEKDSWRQFIQRITSPES